MHRGPALAVIGVAMSVCGLASVFIDQYVVSAAAHLATFVMGSYVVFSSYFVAHYALSRYSRSYNSIPEDKQFYVLSNLIKSAMLLVYTPLAIQILHSTIWLDNWPDRRIKNLGCLYAVLDFVSLLLVKRMSWSTIIHHVCVCVFNVVSISNDYAEENVCRLLVVYAVFSTFAYLVNLLLASRFLELPRKMNAGLAAIALGTYITCCGINWSWQLYAAQRLVHRGHSTTVAIYAGFIMMVVYDDLVLITWLWANIKSNLRLAVEELKEQRTANRPKEE